MRSRALALVLAVVATGVWSAQPAEAAARCQGRGVTITGTPGDDVILGTPGPDVIAALGGHDVILAGAGHDIICAGDGEDRVFGGDGDDRIYGGNGADFCLGGAGNDVARACQMLRATEVRAPGAPRSIPRPGSVALTFDDGPHPTYTPMVLDILDHYRVKATFFVQGWKVDLYPEIARDIVARGHTLLNHSHGHEALWSYSDRTIAWTLTEANRAITDATGITPRCMRPPYGATNPRVERVIAKLGLEVILWDVDSLDYSHESARLALRHARIAEPGDIILMHDTIGPVWREALPPLIESLQERGIGFDTLCPEFSADPTSITVSHAPARRRAATPVGGVG